LTNEFSEVLVHAISARPIFVNNFQTAFIPLIFESHHLFSKT